MFRSWPDCLAWLADEPRNLRPWEIGRLTPLQIAALYLRERDEYGRVRIDAGGGGPSEFDCFKRFCFLNGVTSPKIVRRLYGDWKASFRDSQRAAARPGGE